MNTKAINDGLILNKIYDCPNRSKNRQYPFSFEYLCFSIYTKCSITMCVQCCVFNTYNSPILFTKLKFSYRKENEI